jgi:hypothetical protein
MSLFHVYVYVCVSLSASAYTHTHTYIRTHHTHTLARTEQGSLALSRGNEGVGRSLEILARKRETSIPCDMPPEKWAARSPDEKLSWAAEWIKSRVERGDAGKD